MAFWFWLSMLAQALLLLSLVQALDISYCSPDNTGARFQLVQSLYQSNGACQDTCSAEHAFAVIQGQNCWCSDYAPGYSVNTLRCSQPCPGFPYEWCGSASSGLYAYFQLTLPVSGTSARSTARPSNTPRSSFGVSPSVSPALTVVTVQSTAPAISSEQPTVTVTEQASSTSLSSSEPPPAVETDPPPIGAAPTATPTTLTTSSITSSLSPTHAPSLVPSVITVTEDGTTITSTTSVTPSPDPALGQAAAAQSGSNPARTAGIALGAAGGLATVIALTFCLYRRSKGREQSRSATPDSDRGPLSRGLPTRHASQTSHALLIDKNPRIDTTGLPAGSNVNSAGTSLCQNNRYSAGTDLRLNPNAALYINQASQHSSVSLQDNRDYSRQLLVRNPDS